MFLTLNLKLHFDGKDAGEVLNLGERKNSSKKEGRRRRAPETGLFPILFSSSAGLPFPLTGLQSPYFGQPIKPFKTSI